MDSAFTVQTRPDVDLRNALVLVGAPGVGLVGAIAAEYVVTKLAMPLVGGLYSPHLQAHAPIRDGVAVPPFRIHALETRKRFPGAWERLVVVRTESTPPAAHAASIARSLAEWMRDNGCRRMVVADGVVVEHEAWDDLVWGAASDARGVEFLQKHGVGLVEQGTVGGFSGLLLNAGASAGVESICLLAEAAPGYPDAKAAARVVEVVDAMLPGIVIGTQPLVQEAEAAEAAVRQMQAKLAARVRP